MIIIGIDPGLVKTGWAIIEYKQNNIIYISSGVIKAPILNKDDKNKVSLQNRLTFIFTSVLDIINQYTPISAAIENTYVSINYESSLKLSQARAAAMVACGYSSIPIHEYQATTVKKRLVGNGNADKLQIMKMVRLYIKNAKDMKDTMIHDEADALAIAICHAYAM